MNLNVKGFNRKAMFSGSLPPERGVDLARVARKAAHIPVEYWQESGLVKSNDSFGFAVAHPNIDQEKWDDPDEFTWFVVGWGDEGDRYIANAVRKLRPTIRTMRDTLDLRVSDPGLFSDPVESVVDDNFPWGDFPWGGGTINRVGDIVLAGAVSALKEVEDDAVAKGICGHIGAAMLKLTNPTEFA